jgi:hypothetical protein
LTVKRLPDIELLDHGFWLVRLLCDVRFQYPECLSDPYPAIIDTGAPISIIPRSLWEHAHIRRLRPIRLQGLVARKECAVGVTAGILSAMLQDTNGHHLRRTFRAYLAEHDEVPLILGMQDMLEQGKLFLDLRSKTAWLEFDE